MNKRMREIQAEILKKNAAVDNYLTAGEGRDLDKAEATLNEIDALQKEYDLEERRETMKKADVPKEPAPEQSDAVKAFAAAARDGFPRSKSMNEGTDADGGYTVPEDIVTQIQHYRSAKRSLLNLVSVIPVKTNSGARTFKTRANQTGFSQVGEGAAIGSKATPQFTRLTYTVKKYAGYFAVTNELLADSDAAIANEIITWAGDESRVTANKLILAQINTQDKTTLAGLDDIKKALNVTLGQAFKATSKIITNDDGLQYLDTLKDTDGKYVLQPNPADPMQLRLCAGATIVPIEVVPNDDMPSDSDGIPFVIGDLKEGIAYFDRQTMTLKQSDTAAVGSGASALNAFENDLLLIRAIEREDVKVRDAKAFVNGRIATA